jgi:hypothetical protein
VRWDWMVFPGGSLTLQIIFDLVMPAFLIALWMMPRYYDDDPRSSGDTTVHQYWKYILAALYCWFFAATIWDHFLRPHH